MLTLLVCKSASLQVCKSAGLQVCKSASLQVCRSASLQVCKSAGLQVCKSAVCKCRTPRYSGVCFPIFYCNSAGLSYVARYNGVFIIAGFVIVGFVIAGFVIARCHCIVQMIGGVKLTCSTTKDHLALYRQNKQYKFIMIPFDSHTMKNGKSQNGTKFE